MLFCAFSCRNNTKNNNNDNADSSFFINELDIVDYSHLEQINTIISNSDCFTMHKGDRNEILLIYKSTELLFVSLNYYVGYDSDEIQQIYGGFYATIRDMSFLFIIRKTNYIPCNVYKITNRTIKMKKHSGELINSSDADWYIQNENNRLKLVSINCW